MTYLLSNIKDFEGDQGNVHKNEKRHYEHEEEKI
jgi:hypothetical protein